MRPNRETLYLGNACRMHSLSAHENLSKFFFSVCFGSQKCDWNFEFFTQSIIFISCLQPKWPCKVVFYLCLCHSNPCLSLPANDARGSTIAFWEIYACHCSAHVSKTSCSKFENFCWEFWKHFTALEKMCDYFVCTFFVGKFYVNITVSIKMKFSVWNH